MSCPLVLRGLSSLQLQRSFFIQIMFSSCREHALPEDIKQGSSVKKGTVITFTRDGQGSIEACANEHSLVKVQSQKLAQAVFDIYLGSMVSFQSHRLDCHQYH